MKNSITPEVALATLRNLIITVPSFDRGTLEPTPEQMAWLGRAAAIIANYGSPYANGAFMQGRDGLRSAQKAFYLGQVMQALYDTLTSLEFKVAPGSFGAFIPAGNALDAYSAILRVVEAAVSEVLIVDPYLDARVVTDFTIAVPEAASVLLLADAKSVKASLAPAVNAFRVQYPTRTIQARVTPVGDLHDRYIIIDSKEVWSVSQSIKDLAARSPGAIMRDETELAALKVAHFTSAWDTATALA